MMRQDLPAAQSIGAPVAKQHWRRGSRNVRARCDRNGHGWTGSHQAGRLDDLAMPLSWSSRPRLAQRISTLDQEADADAGKLWRDEAARRLDEIKSGRVAGIPCSSLRREALSFIPKHRTSSYRQPRSASAKRKASG